MRLLAVGDVCGPSGCREIKNKLSLLKKEKNIDFTIVNGENSAEGNGITRQSAEYIFSCGADIITGGNHSLRRQSEYEYLDTNKCILRPHNIDDCQIGSGYYLCDMGRYSVAVINLSGVIYLDRLSVQNPFICVDGLIEQAQKDGARFIVVDFHAEATSEKIALGIYLDGKVSAVFGTHTHVQTADEQILPNGTGYITDLGMTGPNNSVLGVKSDIIINRLRNNDTSKFIFSENYGTLCGCIFEFDDKTGKTVSVERIRV